MRQNGLTRLLAAGALLLLSLTAGPHASAGPHAVVALPNGYYIDRDRSAHARIVNRRGHVIVAGPLAGYAVYRAVVVGLVGEETQPHNAFANQTPLPESTTSGYFILDTMTGQLEASLDVSAWKAKLAAGQVTTAPAIKAPLLP